MQAIDMLDLIGIFNWLVTYIIHL